MKNLSYEAIIVGGGIAGLTAAAYLARAGKKILLIEKNGEFGGLVSSFKDNGYHFEAGVRALESAGIILPMLEDLGIKPEVVRSKVSVGIEQEIIHIEDISSLDEYSRLLVKLYPDSKNEVEKFIRRIRKIMKLVDVLYGIENPLFKNLKRDKVYIFKKLLPWLPRFLFTIRKINRLHMPVEDYLEKIIQNPSLRDIISQHFFKGTPTFFALSYFSLYLDYFYPLGGVGRLADAVKNKISACNGELKSGITIREVCAGDHYIVDQNQVKYHYEHLIWAADLKSLYNRVSAEKLSKPVSTAIHKTKESLQKCKGSESVFTLYLEVDESLSYFRNISHGHFFYTPSRKGLNSIHRNELNQLLSKQKEISRSEMISWLHRFIEFNTFEISIPGLKDPDLVPENKTGLIISFLAEYDLFRYVSESGWYEEFKTETENKIIEVISDSVYPGIKNKIIKQFSFTPLSIEKRIGSSEGAIVGWSFENPVPVIHKINQAAKSVLTPIPSVYQAGQWAYSPAGVPMSILTGKIAADRVIKKSGTGKTTN